VIFVLEHMHTDSEDEKLQGSSLAYGSSSV